MIRTILLLYLAVVLTAANYANAAEKNPPKTIKVRSTAFEDL